VVAGHVRVLTCRADRLGSAASTAVAAPAQQGLGQDEDGVVDVGDHPALALQEQGTDASLDHLGDLLDARSGTACQPVGQLLNITAQGGHADRQSG